MLRVYARGVIGIGFGIGFVVDRIDGLVPGGLLLAVGDVAPVDGHEADDEPAADFADEHLCGLQHRLLELLPFLEVGIVAVAHALVVLWKVAEEDHTLAH